MINQEEDIQTLKLIHIIQLFKNTLQNMDRMESLEECKLAAQDALMWFNNQ